MKTTLKIVSLLVFVLLLITACQKEVSYEQGKTHASVGSMQVDGTGNCAGATPSGLYYVDTTLKSSNYVDVTVQVDTAGTYTISTDQVNGYSFKATGTFSDTGSKVVRLMGSGKPLSSGTNIFTVTYNGTTCDFSVTVNVGTGGSSAFTVNCASAVPNGTYQTGTALVPATNTVTLTVNVTAVGSWSITTAPAVNGIIFSGSGTFTTTGSQTITLAGSGTPAIAGAFNFPVTVNGATCNFSVTCTSAIPDYFPRTTNSNWSYEFDDNPNDSLLIKVIPQTITAVGQVFNIFVVTDNASLGFDTSGYYRRSGNDYIEWIDMGSFVGLDNPLWMENTFLKDNAPVGAAGAWNSSQFSGPFTPTGGSTVTVTLRWEYSITQKDVPITVNGQTYANTIEVRQELRQLISGIWQLGAYIKAFYARDKGLIKQDLYSSTNTLIYSLEVRRVDVK